MDNYIVVLTIVGFAALSMAWMPAITKKTGVSYALFYVLFGIVLYLLLDSLPLPKTIEENEYILRLTEFVVIITLMGTGLKIDQPFTIKGWAVPFRLVLITMVLCIATVTIAGYSLLDFDIASALLLAAAIAPTDPVLASDVQVGPPMEKSSDKIRFSLTAEAGMNDGMAFPFTWLAIVVALMARSSDESIGHWVWFYLIYKVVAGVIIGYVLGRLMAYLVFYLPTKYDFLVTREGFVALSATLLVYGITEGLHGYGFVSVFVAAVTIRNYEIQNEYHIKLHEFTDQVERILIAIVAIIFGGSLVSGVLEHLTVPYAIFGLVFIIIIRPLVGMLTLIGTDLHLKEKLAISFFGIRGIGSFYYLAFALSITEYFMGKQLWSLVAFIVLLSIVIHGLTATPIIRKLRKQFDSPSDHEMKKDGIKD